MNYYIGLDIGGTTVKGGVVTPDGTIIYKSSIPTNAKASCADFAKDLADFCVVLAKEAEVSMDSIKSVGMGIPGTVDTKNGIVIYANNINMENSPIVEEFKKHLNLDVSIDNDANCAALGEYSALSDKSIKDFVAVTLGTGVGSGIIMDGKIFSGVTTGGGEIGHMVIAMDGEPCTCGRKGCWEAYASATALAREAALAAQRNPDSLLAQLIKDNGGKPNGKIVWEASGKGDKTAVEVTDKFCEYVAQGVVNIVNIFRPQVVAIGGGVSMAGKALLEPVREYVNKYHYGAGVSVPSKIITAELGNDAGIVGAAFLGK